jgi:hypothetical protein
MNTVRRLFFGMAAIAGIAAAQIPINACAPDAQMTVGETPQGYYHDSRSSNGTAYNTQGCFTSYTVDITMFSNYKGPGNGTAIGGGFDRPYLLTEADCKYASESVVILKRTYNTFFGWGAWQNYSTQQQVTGKWVSFNDTGNPYCALSAPVPIVPPASVNLIDQYRVMVLPMLAGSVVQARVTWGWTY